MMTIFQRRSLCTRAMMGAGFPLTAALLLWGGYGGNAESSTSAKLPASNNIGLQTRSVTESLVKVAKPIETVLACSASSSTESGCNSRTKQTPADSYFHKHKELPPPSVMHATLPPLNSDNNNNRRKMEESKKNVLVIGDVHGCFEEMQELHQKAVQENDGLDFEYIIMVGDLCNKGPQSAEVIRFVRLQEDWFSVRGNHDNGALEAALGDKDKRKKKKYKWVLEGESDDSSSSDSSDSSSEKDSRVTLSDEDVAWLSELPYSLTIPGSYFREDVDTIIVHGGFIPGVELDSQEIETMTTIREVTPVCKLEDVIGFKYHERKDGHEAIVSDGLVCKEPRPWANVWNSMQEAKHLEGRIDSSHLARVIFGHDARRGLQRYEGDWAIGLDSGAVYGRGMTAIILPERRLVSIDTQEHCPTG
jgi:bis(5'-nucleosyl)-tetraphosphatase (symmetrical)